MIYWYCFWSGSLASNCIVDQSISAHTDVFLTLCMHARAPVLPVGVCSVPEPPLLRLIRDTVSPDQMEELKTVPTPPPPCSYCLSLHMPVSGWYYSIKNNSCCLPFDIASRVEKSVHYQFGYGSVVVSWLKPVIQYMYVHMRLTCMLIFDK